MEPTNLDLAEDALVAAGNDAASVGLTLLTVIVGLVGITLVMQQIHKARA